MMQSLEIVRGHIERAITGVEIEVLPNPGPSGQDSLLVEPDWLVAVATFLRDDDRYRFDYCSNVTGVDWPDRTLKEKVKVAGTDEEGNPTEEEKTVERFVPGYLEAVYHLYSISERLGPLVLRVRTGDRDKDVEVPSLTPVWRSCEFQEREIFDLYGIRFSDHPDLRRLLMWDNFEGHPMRKDYQTPEQEAAALAAAEGKGDA